MGRTGIPLAEVVVTGKISKKKEIHVRINHKEFRIPLQSSLLCDTGQGDQGLFTCGYVFVAKLLPAAA